MTSEALIFILSTLGISETVYLIKKRLRSEKPVCLIGEDCAKVLTSPHSKMFIVSNDILGLLFYIACSLAASFLVIGVAPLPLWDIIIKILVFLGSLLSIFLVYLQLKVIKAWCFWCLMSAIIVWLMGVIIIINDLIK